MHVLLVHIVANVVEHLRHSHHHIDNWVVLRGIINTEADEVG